MKEFVKSKVTGKSYEPSKVVRILNVAQTAAYLNNGAELLDVYPSINYTSEKPLLVFVFDREKSSGLYDLWCKRELN